MMNSEETRLVLRDIPAIPYMLGLIFAGVGGFLYFQSGEAVLLLFAAIGLGFLLLTSVLTITADRVQRTLKLEYRSAFRHSDRQFPFDDIVGIGVERIDRRNRHTYRVVLKQRDGQLIPFRSTSSTGSRQRERQAANLRDFIGVPAFNSSPAGRTYAALQAYMDKTQETGGVRWQVQPVGSARWYSPDFKTPGVFLCLTQKAEGQSSRGILASLGSMVFKQILSGHYHADDTPGLDRAAALNPLDPALEPRFMAFTNAAEPARRILGSGITALLADWAARHPLKVLNKPSGYGQLTILFSPNGVYLAPTNPLQPDQVEELAALGVGLVKSQGGIRALSASQS